MSLRREYMLFKVSEVMGLGLDKSKSELSKQPVNLVQNDAMWRKIAREMELDINPSLLEEKSPQKKMLKRKSKQLQTTQSTFLLKRNKIEPVERSLGDFFHNVPSDILKLIIFQLCLKDIHSLVLVCKGFREFLYQYPPHHWTTLESFTANSSKTRDTVKLINVLSLARFDRLENFKIYSYNPVKEIMGKFIDALSSRPLLHFTFEKSKINSKKMMALCEKLTPIFSNLKTLNLCDNLLGNDGQEIILETIKDSKNLLYLNLSRNFINAITPIVEMLKKPTCLLTELNLSDNPLGTGEVYKIAQVLELNIPMTSLNLSYSIVGPMEVIFISLMKNTRLIKLNLSRNIFGYTEFTSNSLQKALTINRTLLSLNLSRNEIKLHGLIAISKVIGDSKCSLTDLDLSQNNFPIDGSIVFSEALKINQSLIHLNLSQTQTFLEGINALMGAIGVNTHLRTFIFDRNYIGALGGISLANALNQNSSIIHLSLGSNKIGCKGIIEIIKAIKYKPIEYFNLAKSNIGKKVMHELIIFARNSRILKTLAIPQNAMTLQIEKKWQALKTEKPWMNLIWTSASEIKKEKLLK